MHIFLEAALDEGGLNVLVKNISIRVAGRDDDVLDLTGCHFIMCILVILVNTKWSHLFYLGQLTTVMAKPPS